MLRPAVDTDRSIPTPFWDTQPEGELGGTGDIHCKTDILVERIICFFADRDLAAFRADLRLKSEGAYSTAAMPSSPFFIH